MVEDVCEIGWDVLLSAGGDEIGGQPDVGSALEEEVLDCFRYAACVAQSGGVGGEFVEMVVEAAVARPKSRNQGVLLSGGG